MDPLDPIFESEEEEKFYAGVMRRMAAQENHPELMLPFYDTDEDIKRLKDIYVFSESTPQMELELDCLDWHQLINTPIHIVLPTIISFEPKRENKLPLGRLYGVLMTFEVFGEKRRPKADGVVFILGDQEEFPPVHLGPSALWDWAMDTDNCPESMRYSSLAHSLLVICGNPGCPYPVGNTGKRVYFQATRSWKIEEWGYTLEELIGQNIPFIEYCEPLGARMPSKKKTLKRKRKIPEKRVENLPAETGNLDDWSTIDIASIFSTISALDDRRGSH